MLGSSARSACSGGSVIAEETGGSRCAANAVSACAARTSGVARRGETPASPPSAAIESTAPRLVVLARAGARDAIESAMNEREERVLERGQDRDRECIGRQHAQEHGADVVLHVERARDHLHVEGRVVVAEHQDLEDEDRGGEQREHRAREPRACEQHEREHESDRRHDVEENARLRQPAAQPAERGVEHRELAGHERGRKRRPPAAREPAGRAELSGRFCRAGRLQAPPE